MAYTLQNVCDQARVPLNDSAKTRVPDSELLRYGNDFILNMSHKRPDLFFGSYPITIVAKVLADAFPLPDEYVPACADYMTARAELKNEEAASMPRAPAFLALAEGELK